MNINNQNTERVPGISCPRCNQFIQTSIAELLADKSIRCTHCNLQLIIDHQQSQTALDALEKVDKAQRRVEEKR